MAVRAVRGLGKGQEDSGLHFPMLHMEELDQ